MTPPADLIPALLGVGVLEVLTVAVLTAYRVAARFAPAWAILRGAVQLAAISLVLSGIITNGLLVEATWNDAFRSRKDFPSSGSQILHISGLRSAFTMCLRLRLRMRRESGQVPQGGRQGDHRPRTMSSGVSSRRLRPTLPSRICSSAGDDNPAGCYGGPIPSKPRLVL
jgi:hypothetical protein